MITIGTMTGNSLDAADVVMTEFSGAGSIHDIAGVSVPYPAALRQDMLDLREEIIALGSDMDKAAKLPKFRPALKTYTELLAGAVEELLAKSGVPFVTRVPLIPAVTDTPENLGSIAKIIARAGATRAELLPYNRFAGGKYASLGRKYSPSFDESAPPSPHTEIFEKYGVKAVVL